MGSTKLSLQWLVDVTQNESQWENALILCLILVLEFLKSSDKFNLLKSYYLFLIFSITINLVTTSIIVPLIMILDYNGKYAFAFCRPLDLFSSNISPLIPIHFVFFVPYRQCLVLLIIIVTILFRLLCHSSC